MKPRPSTSELPRQDERCCSVLILTSDRSQFQGMGGPGGPGGRGPPGGMGGMDMASMMGGGGMGGMGGMDMASMMGKHSKNQ